jgi:SAM-dependent methyltransferase
VSDFAFDQLRYLASKKSVDDRALNRVVWQSFTEAVSHVAGRRLTIMEVGAGTGSMLERLIQWQVFDGHLGADRREVSLELVDNDRLALDRARQRAPALADAYGWGRTEISEGWRLQRASTQLDVHFTVGDVRELTRETNGGRHDVLIAHAFLDLFHLPTVVPALLRALVPGGLFYFTLNYDGATIFEPVTDQSLEDAVQTSYHNTMDNRMAAGQRSGDSAAGRHLYHVLTACGAEVVEFGSSDWVVFPRSGDYPGDEEYFLRCILWLVEQALRADTDLPVASVEGWLRQRRGQLQARELIFVAHQLDIVGRAG